MSSQTAEAGRGLVDVIAEIEAKGLRWAWQKDRGGGYAATVGPEHAEFLADELSYFCQHGDTPARALSEALAAFEREPGLESETA